MNKIQLSHITGKYTSECIQIKKKLDIHVRVSLDIQIRTSLNQRFVSNINECGYINVLYSESIYQVALKY